MQRLPQLVVLHLRDIIPSQAAAKHLAAMPSLHNLELYVAEEDSERLAQLPCRLTSLTVTRQARMEDMLRPTLPPQMPALVHLQQLELVDCSLAPAQLGSMTSLKILCLDSCTLLPCVDDGGTYHRKLSSPAAVTGFLNAIRQLTYLRHLELEDLHLDVAGLPAEQWSALTASTQLTRLMLHGEGHSPRLPAGAVQQMFSVGRRLPHLRKLILQFNGYQCQDSWCLDSGDLHSIIGGCPQLHSLCLLRTVCKGADVSALLQLPASCTRLVIGGNAFAHSAVPVVLQLTQLRKLRWWDSTPFNDRTLLQLTTLTHLSKLEIMCSDDVSTSIWEAAGVETPCSDDTITLCTDTKVGTCAGVVVLREQSVVLQPSGCCSRGVDLRLTLSPCCNFATP